MQNTISPGKLLQMLAFTSKDVASYVGVSPVMIRKIMSGQSEGSKEVQKKIRAYVSEKISTVQASLGG